MGELAIGMSATMAPARAATTMGSKVDKVGARMDRHKDPIPDEQFKYDLACTHGAHAYSTHLVQF